MEDKAADRLSEIDLLKLKLIGVEMEKIQAQQIALDAQAKLFQIRMAQLRSEYESFRHALVAGYALSETDTIDSVTGLITRVKKTDQVSA